MAKLLPQYDIERLLGHGGMGVVYQGRQRSLDRAVAIKILPPGLDDVDASYVERFKNEARIMAKLDHPAIVPVHDFGETAEGQLYIVMAFVDGTDVAQMIRRQGRLPPEHALAITAHVCDALGYAHTHGIVHRDIKPANILINREGAVKVADFGLTKADEPGSGGLTKTGMAMGTPDYVAPEALIMGTQIDGRADLYAIGVMLYHMLTGDVPRGTFKPAGVRFPGLDPRFDAIIQKSMQMDREERYQTSGEIRRDLDAIHTLPLVQAGGESSAAIPQSSPSARITPISPNSKSKTSMIALTTVAVAAAVVIAGAFVALKPATPEAASASDQTAITRSDESGATVTALQDAAATPKAPTPPSNPKPLIVAQANTTPKFKVNDLGANVFIGEWFEEQDPSGPRVVIFADGRAQLWRKGSQDQRTNGTFWWTDWAWRVNGADLEVLNEKKAIFQTWKLTGGDTATSTGEKVIQKRRAKDLWSDMVAKRLSYRHDTRFADDPVTASFSPKELQMELACALYARKRVSMAQGARMAEMERMDFQAVLCDRDIPVHYTGDDLRTDMESLQALLPA